MRKLIYIISIILFSGCTKEKFMNIHKVNKNSLGGIPPKKYKVHDLILFTGESNLRGEASNLEAPTSQLGIRSGVIISSITRLRFQTLNIGVNNQSRTGFHGLELGLANSVDTGLMKVNNPVYTAKTAVGGSRISDWVVGSVNWNNMIKVLDTAIKQLTIIDSGVKPRVYIWYGQGQNDYKTMNSFVWKDSTKIHLANLRAHCRTLNPIWDVPIFITYLPEPTFSTYNFRITEICNELANTYAIQTPPVANNGSHWNYADFLIIADRFIYTMKSHYPYR